MKILRYLKPYWLYALLAPCCMVVEVVVDLLQPKLLSKIVDYGILSGDMDLIVHTGLVMLGLVAIGGIGGIASGAFANIASQNFGNDLRKDVFSSVMNLSFQQTDKFTTGSLVTRLTNDTNAVQDFVGMAIRMFVRTSMLFIGGIVMMLTLSVNFGLVLLCSLPIQVAVIWLFLSKASPLFSAVQKKLDRVNAVVQENITGARVVKAYVKEEYEIGRFFEANSNLKESTLKVQKIMARLSPVLMIVMNLSVVAIIYIGGWQVEARSMLVGEVMAAVTYTTQILHAMMMVSNIFQSVTRAKVSMQRINEVLDTMPAITDGVVLAEQTGGEINFSNVSFYYPASSKKMVLHHINLAIHKGENFAILGATGSGKSSLVHLISRFYDAVDGEVLIDGVNVKEYTLQSLRSKAVVVLQKSELFSGTVMENIRVGRPGASDDEVIEAARIAQADDFIQSFQNGYQTIIGEKGASLSGGQKQRMAIARAVLKRPPVLIFDDSFSALDLNTEAKLKKALAEHVKGTTIITIAQRIASVVNADRIAVIEGGTIAALGTHSQLIQQSAIYQDIYNSQMGQGGVVCE